MKISDNELSELQRRIGLANMPPTYYCGVDVRGVAITSLMEFVDNMMEKYGYDIDKYVINMRTGKFVGIDVAEVQGGNDVDT